MLNLEEKEYDLNFLCSFTFDFQMLKEILIKLAKSNIDLQNKLKKLEKSKDIMRHYTQFVHQRLTFYKMQVKDTL